MSFPRSVSRIDLRAMWQVLVFMMLVCIWDLGHTAEARSRGVRHEFAKARALFDRGRLSDSAKVLQRIIKKYPGNKASYYLLGRIQYRRGKVRKAAKYFNRGGLNFAAGDGAFEYGISMFVVRKCSKAISAFKRVRGSLKGLANFYSGVCYIRSRRWYQAERSLRAASKIPTNLKVMRQRFLTEIQKKKRQEQLGAVAPPVPYTPVPVPWSTPQSYQTPGLPPGEGAPGQEELGIKKKKPIAKPAPPKIRRGLSYSITPKARYLSQTVIYDRHQTGKKTKSTKGPSGGGDLQIRYDYKPDRHGRQTSIKGDFNLDVKNLNVNSTDVSFFISEDGESASASESVTVDQDKSMTYKAEPSISIPFGARFDLDAGGLYQEKWPDYKSDNKQVTVGPDGGLGAVFDSFSVRVTGSSYNKEKVVETDEEISIAKTTDTTIRGSADLSLGSSGFSLNAHVTQTQTSDPSYYSLDGFESSMVAGGGISKGWENLTLSLSGTQSTNTPPSGTVVNGTASEMKAVGEASLALKFGLSLKGFFEYAQIGEYYRKGLCESTEEDEVVECEEAEQQTAQATGVRQGFGGTVKFAPIDWGYASASWSRKETVYTLKQTELLLDFRSKVTDYVDDIKFLIGLSYTL